MAENIIFKHPKDTIFENELRDEKFTGKIKTQDPLFYFYAQISALI